MGKWMVCMTSLAVIIVNQRKIQLEDYYSKWDLGKWMVCMTCFAVIIVNQRKIQLEDY